MLPKLWAILLPPILAADVLVSLALAPSCAALAATPAQTRFSASPSSAKPHSSRVIIGVNAALGRGEGFAKAVRSAGFTSDRIEPLVRGRDLSYENVPKIAGAFRFTDNAVLVGDINHGGPRSREASLSEWATEPNLGRWTARALGEVEEAARYGNTLMEVGNEMFLVAAVPGFKYPQPQAYAQMFVALSKAVDAAKHRAQGYKLPSGVRLLFNLFGEYEESNDKWSELALSAGKFHGWLGDALEAPGEVGKELRSRIEGFSFHAYETRVRSSKGRWEAAKEPRHDSGTLGLKYDYEEAQDLGLGTLPVYVTELGFTTSGSVQAAEVKGEYEELLAFPEVKGIWYFAAGPETEKKTGLFELWHRQWRLDKAGQALLAVTG
jgi:hypothetical protein